MEELSDGKYYGDNVQDDVFFKVIVDYVWVIMFVISDGVLFFNEGCGYVIWWLIWWVILYG